MGARWLEQKRAKQKRMRRSWAKSLSMRGSGPSPVSGYVNKTLNEDGTVDRHYVSMSISSRSKAAGSVEAEITPKLMNKWVARILMDGMAPMDIPKGHEAHGRRVYVRPDSPRTPLQLVVAKLSQSSDYAGALQGEQRFICSKVKDGRYWKLYLYSCSDEAYFVELKTEGEKTMCRRSIRYSSMERAMWDCNRGHIPWTSETEVHDPPE